ncbi:MAG TPA: TonB-dependent receptor, partial [Burkholderiaceae bacterium]
ALVYNPQGTWSLYGAWSTGMESGGVAPVGTTNANSVLEPARSTQMEFGAKAELVRGMVAAASVFEIEKPLETTNAANAYVQRGDARHRGVELSLQGRVQRELMLGASVAYLDATQLDTGDKALDGRRVVNVPRLKSTVFADWAVSSVPGLKLNATWQHAGRKAFDTANTVMVPGYHVVNLGAAYATTVGGTRAVLRANVDNVADKFYWRDVTQSLGGYLLPGLPRVFKLSAQFDW